MTTEAEVIEPTEERALVVVQPGNALVSRIETGPATMIAQATALASALRDIVERQNLYTLIQGKKYPQVEAWMTIGRMDNVVAREAERPIRNEDGSYEAFVELVRLSDGMVIGRASALCGMPDDEPWGGTPPKWGKPAKPPRPEYARRSMAVTRATSRAFRQQYSWIMALAGYEATPADEMPQDARDVSPRREDEDRPAEQRTTHRDGLIGKAIAQGTQDFQLRQGPDGPALPFRIKEGRLSQIAVAKGPIAVALDTYREEVLGQRITVWGHYTDEEYYKNDQKITYKVLHVERIKTPAFEMPAQGDPLPGRGGPLEPTDRSEDAADVMPEDEPVAPEPLFPPLSDEEMEAIGAGAPG